MVTLLLILMVLVVVLILVLGVGIIFLDPLIAILAVTLFVKLCKWMFKRKK